MGGWLALGENYFLGEVFLDLKTIYTFLGVSRAVSCVQFESCALTGDSPLYSEGLSSVNGITGTVAVILFSSASAHCVSWVILGFYQAGFSLVTTHYRLVHHPLVLGWALFRLVLFNFLGWVFLSLVCFILGSGFTALLFSLAVCRSCS